jgi:hypothetical protein
MPRRQISCAGSPAISQSAKRTEPSLGRNVPEIKLKIVLLPDPFGPMRPRISPSTTSKLTRLTATNPPNRLVRPLTASIDQCSVIAGWLHRIA